MLSYIWNVKRSSNNKQIFDAVKYDIRNYSVELVIFDDAQPSRISTKRYWIIPMSHFTASNICFIIHNSVPCFNFIIIIFSVVCFYSLSCVFSLSKTKAFETLILFYCFVRVFLFFYIKKKRIKVRYRYRIWRRVKQ